VTSLGLHGDSLIATDMTGMVRIYALSNFELKVPSTVEYVDVAPVDEHARCERYVQVELAAHSRTVTAMDINYIDKTFVTCSEDSHVNVWTLPTITRSVSADTVRAYTAQH